MKNSIIIFSERKEGRIRIEKNWEWKINRREVLPLRCLCLCPMHIPYIMITAGVATFENSTVVGRKFFDLLGAV
jgi:hypothetical protein